jgi:hypothetical protein
MKPTYDLTETPILLNGTLSSKLNGSSTNGHSADTTVSDLAPKKSAKFQADQPLPVSNASCNYDNLRSIDDTTGDEMSGAELTTVSSSAVMRAQFFRTQQQQNGKTNSPTSNGSTPIQQQPLNDKNLMNNILSKTSLDHKSQSMFTPNNGSNGNTNGASLTKTPVATVS